MFIGFLVSGEPTLFDKTLFMRCYKCEKQFVAGVQYFSSL